ncbi:MAG: hypothetical protein ABEH43_06565, partial [Flavobacteriales bacterium]
MRISTILLLCFGLLNMNGFSQKVWQKTFGGTGDEYPAWEIIKTQDGNYLITGTTTSWGAGGSDIFLMKFNADGDTLWTKTYGGSGDETGGDIIQASNGDLIIVGLTKSFGSGSNDVLMIRTDSVGNEKWSKTYGGGDDEPETPNINEQKNGDLLVISSTKTGDVGGTTDIYVLKTDSVGNKLWGKKLGESNLDQLFDLIELKNKSYIISESRNTSTCCAGEPDFTLLKLNSDGDTIWTKGVGFNDWDRGISLALDKDSNLVCTGLLKDESSTINSPAFLKFDTAGTLLSKKFYQSNIDNGTAINIINTKKNNNLLVGQTYSFGAG